MGTLTRLAVLAPDVEPSDRAEVERALAPAVEEAPAASERLPPLVGSFKYRNGPLQGLVREWNVLRTHNLGFKDGDPQDRLLLTAEYALVCLALENFLRAVVADAHHPRVAPEQTLFSLLEWAISRKLVRLPWLDQAEGIERVCKVRNSIMHANFAQAAKDAGCTSIDHFFRTQFASELEAMTRILDTLVRQIDPETGKPRTGETPAPPPQGG